MATCPVYQVTGEEEAQTGKVLAFGSRARDKTKTEPGPLGVCWERLSWGLLLL